MAKLPPLPSKRGRISTFGGSGDEQANERLAGLAFTTISRHGKGGYGALKYLLSLSSKPLWFRAMFRSDAQADAIARLNPNWGLFAYLADGALFCAGRWKGGSAGNKLWDDENPWVTFTNEETGEKITCLRIDWGPSETITPPRDYDLSEYAAEFIHAKTNSFVTAEYATPEEIARAKAYMLDLWNKGATGTALFKKFKSQGHDFSGGEIEQSSSMWIPLLLIGGAFALWTATTKQRGKR